jgi:toxin ParE1/3/4
LKLFWTHEAEEDRAAIFDFIASENPAAAERMDIRFRDAVGRLAMLPMLGRAGRVAGTRELIPHKSYRIVYEVEDGRIVILAIVHTARLWPPLR